MGMFSGDKLEAWEIERGRALEAVARAEELHAATMGMLWRVEQANIKHHERDLDPSGGRADNKTPTQEEIEHDEGRRKEERKHGKAAMFGEAIKEALAIIGTARKGR